jgi:hypothetical protein
VVEEAVFVLDDERVAVAPDANLLEPDLDERG